MSNHYSYNYPIEYKGANISFLKDLIIQQQKNTYCSCIRPQYKKFATAENNPYVSNAVRTSQILSAGPAIGGRVNFVQQNVYSSDLAPGFRNKLSSPIRNKF